MSSLFSSTRNTRILPTGTAKYMRSDFPQHLSDEEVQWLIEHNFHTLLDLRTEEEVMARPCVLQAHPEFEYIHLPVTGGADVPRSRERLYASYKQMVDAQMERIVETIMNKKSGVLYFCTAGKDRTGVVSAIILKRLGFCDEVIINDYMRSKDNLEEVLAAYVRVHPDVDIEVITPNRENMENLLKHLND